MQELNIDEMAAIVENSENYRVIRKYQKPEYYHEPDYTHKLIGVYLDIEATGLLYSQDKLIELGMVKFQYAEDGRIFSIIDEFNQYQDPDMPIPQNISKLTGITNEMVEGHQINEITVIEFLKNVDIIIAHNASFDRAFFETTFPLVPAKAWGCSMYDINWKRENIESHKLEYIAYKYGFFFEGHRAINDCLAGLHILSQDLPVSKQLALKELLNNANQYKFKIWAANSPYECKDLLKSRNYRWGHHPTKKFKSWYIEVTQDKVESEINYLRLNVYKGKIDIPVDIFDAYNRFSVNNHGLRTPTEHQALFQWIRGLQTKTITLESA